MSPEEQETAIAEAQQDPVVAEAYLTYRRDLQSRIHFLKHSGRYTLYAPGNLGKGHFNIYRMFVETALRTAREGGYAAQVTPGNLYGGANASAIRQHLLNNCSLDTIFGLINTRRDWFPKVDIDRFAAYSAQVGGSTKTFKARFGITTAHDLSQDAIIVPADLIRAQAPSTFAIPDLRNPLEMTVAAKIVDAYPPFGDETSGPPFRHYQTEVHMGNDTELFTNDPSGLPIYEGRMIDAFDHQAKSYVSGHGNSAKWETHDFDDPQKTIVPQWRILRKNIPSKLGNRCDQYRIGFCDVANPRNRRSLTAALIPPGVACGHKVPTIIFEPAESWAYMPWLAVANSLVMDWLTRSRLSSSTLSYTVMDSLPFPRWPIDHPMVHRLAPLALRLSCTSTEMTDYWNSMAQYGWCDPEPTRSVPPKAIIKPPLRAAAMAEIDAVVARGIYGLDRSEFAYVLDQFTALKRRDRKVYGRYMTKERTLAAYDAIWAR